MQHNYASFPVHMTAKNIRELVNNDNEMRKVRERITDELNKAVQDHISSNSITINGINLNRKQLEQLNTELDERGFSVYYSPDENFDSTFYCYLTKYFNEYNIPPKSMRIFWY